ncbi:MAG: hypothetical protein DME05_05640 [Candidatus Rokuibacteriota bacterium]|nr:MAG: hypothetical protein DME05_05640 [Candidatus Rokubacteria bacterium]PYN75693.1 MAG: hypothetical protein DMD97_13955 [Candidatus Rokubacteria bacterium]
MPLNADDLRKRLSTLNERFSALAESLAQTARQLQISGSLPPESLLDEINKVRADFGDVRHRVLDAARALALNSPAMSEIDSIKALEPVLESVVQAVVAEEKRNAATEARKRVMAVLDRVLAIAHADGPNFAALVQCQAKAKEIQAAAQDPKAFDTDNAPAFLESTPSFAALLSMIEGREALDDEKFAALEDTVTQAFGRALAVAATRGKLLVGGPAPAAPERPAQPAPKAAEPAVKPAAPTPPSAPPRPEPVIVGTGTPVAPPLKTPGPSEHVHVNAAAPAPAQAVEQATQDEAAQWWVSAWARWTSWRGTLSFVDAVKEELGKYNYVLSVPIQKSTDYEDGLLAYGYSILLDYIEHRAQGFINKALNSLKTFQPGGQSTSVGAHLYNVLVSEGRLRDQYPDFVKEVLLAAVPEPGLWTHARILESTTETRIFTHPSNRIGDPEHNSQRLTQERQRFADHRFPIVVPALTTRFFAIAADLREPRSIDVKLQDGRTESDNAWLMTMPPVGRADLKSELQRLGSDGSSVPGLGRDYATLWVAVFNPDPGSEKKYELTLSLRQSTKQSAGTFRSARTA